MSMKEIGQVFGIVGFSTLAVVAICAVSNKILSL